MWNEPKRRSAYRNGPYKVPAIEFAIQKTSATRAGNLTSNHLQCRHCPSPAMISPYRTFVEAYPFTLILHMRGRQKCATVTGDASRIERGAINFAMRRSRTC
jgi:hypothetical protein